MKTPFFFLCVCVDVNQGFFFSVPPGDPRVEVTHEPSTFWMSVVFLGSLLGSLSYIRKSSKKVTYR